MLGAFRDMTNPYSRQSSRHTAARVSEKVGSCLRCQVLLVAVGRTWGMNCLPSNITSENRQSRHGVVRAMALSDRRRWVSTPRWSRASWKVTFSCQR